ncbi:MULTISPECIES: hypothetical protein [unclassified Lentimonas]|uniref:hypothetical protein n=1 Tax=unclassified Lentimonas TaxID=2630993 RepID=UPI00138A6569|nr:MULTISPECIES: hypothetical protein [unclassified Lentimonas]
MKYFSILTIFIFSALSACGITDNTELKITITAVGITDPMIQRINIKDLLDDYEKKKKIQISWTSFTIGKKSKRSGEIRFRIHHDSSIILIPVTDNKQHPDILFPLDKKKMEVALRDGGNIVIEQVEPDGTGQPHVTRPKIRESL